MNAFLAVGFGDVTVTRDGKRIYSELTQPKTKGGWAKAWTAKHVEKIAAKDPKHDWRVLFLAPLYEAEYQRQGKGHWPLVRKGLGFA